MAGRIKRGTVNAAQFAAPEEPGTCGRVMIKNSLFHQLGGYDEEFHPVGCQDFDLVTRATCASPEGAAVLVKDPKQIGLSIANRPHTGWSECVAEKVVNVDPNVYQGWKFGKMDSENRDRMKRLLLEGKLQRNEGKQIGVVANEIKLQVVDDYPPEPDDVPDWGGSVHGGDTDDDPGVTGPTTTLAVAKAPCSSRADTSICDSHLWRREVYTGPARPVPHNSENARRVVANQGGCASSDPARLGRASFGRVLAPSRCDLGRALFSPRQARLDQSAHGIFDHVDQELD